MRRPSAPSLVQRRSSGQLLEPLRIPPLDSSEPVRPVLMQGGDAPGPAEEEVQEEGRELFEHFVYDQIERDPSVGLDDVNFNTPRSYKNPMWAKAGRDLRAMADQFAKTEERRRVRQRAEQMGVEVNYEQFRDLLSQLFAEGGITRERIIVLFYFCSDVAINALRAGKDLFLRFLNWSLSFISEYVCSWVHQHGGWGQVLKAPFNSVTKLCVWGVTLVAVILFFKYVRSR